MRQTDAAPWRVDDVQFGRRQLARCDGVQCRPGAKRIPLNELVDAFCYHCVAHSIDKVVQAFQLFDQGVEIAG